MNSILLFVSVFIKHAGHVWYFIMFGDFGDLATLSFVAKILVIIEVLFLNAIHHVTRRVADVCAKISAGPIT